MPRYRFKSVNATGATETGEVDASRPDAAFARLERRGLVVELLEEIATPQRSAGELSREDVADFARQLAGLARSGVTLHSALRALGRELPSGNLSSVFNAIAADLEKGQSLDEAIETESQRFPAHVRGLVLAGTRSGRLAEVLSEFSQYEEATAELRRRLWISLSYPVMLLVGAGALFILLAKYVVVDFEKIFADFGVDLPHITKGLIRTANAMNRLGPWVVIGPFIAFALLWSLERLVLGRVQQRRLALEIPLVGGLWKWSALAEFAHLLAVLVESELPLTEALSLAGQGSHDPSLNEAAERMTAVVEEGEPLSLAVAQRPEFPNGFAQILQWAETHQSLPEALHMAAEIYEARARAHAALVGTIFAVVTIIFVIFGVFYVYVGLFWPLYDLIARLSG